AIQSVEVDKAEVKRTQTWIDDSVLKSPVKGRVLYRLAEEGEVLASGGKVLTLLNLMDVYMDLYLPSQEAARIKYGDEARIVLDARPIGWLRRRSRSSLPRPSSPPNRSRPEASGT